MPAPAASTPTAAHPAGAARSPHGGAAGGRKRFSSLDAFVERVWRLFCSLRLMTVLMVLFAVGMAVGSFINPQEDELAQIERAFADRPAVLWMYRFFELYAPYRSWWFTLILVLLALNNTAASIERLPRIFLVVRNPERRLTDRVLRGVRRRAEVARGPATPAPAEVEAQLRRDGWRVAREEEPGPDGAVLHLFAERGAWTRFGVWAVHVALDVVLVGGVLGRWFGVDGVMNVPADGGVRSSFEQRLPDGTVLRRPLGFSLRVDAFHLDTFADGSARRFASDVAVLDDRGNELLRRTISVNHPLRHGGLTLYQASYQELRDQARARMLVRDRVTGERTAVRAVAGEPFFTSPDGVRYEVVDHRDDFDGLGPAVQVARVQPQPDGRSKVSGFWVFARYPDFDADNRGDRWSLSFEELEPGYVTGLQVGRNPGIPWIYGGFALMVAGLFVTFRTSHRRLWLRVEPHRVVVAGATHRNAPRLQRDMDALLARLGAPQAGGAPADD